MLVHRMNSSIYLLLRHSRRSKILEQRHCVLEQLWRYYLKNRKTRHHGCKNLTIFFNQVFPTSAKSEVNVCKSCNSAVLDERLFNQEDTGLFTRGLRHLVRFTDPIPEWSVLHLTWQLLPSKVLKRKILTSTMYLVFVRVFLARNKFI